MFASRKWTRIALAVNAAGALLLFFSFQATSSSFRLIRRPFPASVLGQEYSYEICVEDFALLSTDAQGDMTLGHKGCPIASDDRRAAVVNTEHPIFVTIGFLMILGGFIIQFFAVPEPRTIAELRQEIKLLKVKDKPGTRR